MGIIYLFQEIVNLLTPQNLFFVFVAVQLGIIIGMLPGLTATMGIALLTTLTFKWETGNAILTLIAIYVGAIYGGSRSAILLNIPGTPASAATCLDGYPLAKSGQGAQAIGLATTLRVTPALFILYFFYKRRWTNIAGAAAGAVLFCWLVPGLILGFEYNNLLFTEWVKQMIQPFLSGALSGGADHINQSFTGAVQRFLTDSVAVKADVERGYEALKVNVASLDHGSISLIVKMASLLVVGCLAWFCRTPKDSPKYLGNMGEYAMVFLATLFISPRSWKPAFSSTHKSLSLYP